MPEADDDVEIELNWDEIRVDTFRSSGAGGQHVQKTESAIRLTHLPTGIVVTCQNERSATQNRELAIRVLKSRLLELELEKREEELRKLRGEHVTAGWGNQIRSYVLHPYQMVKDLRSGHETSNTGAVLDGDLDTFMQAELERVATGRPPSADDDGRVARGRSDGRRGRRARAAARSAYRPGRDDDLDPCTGVWKAAVDDYQAPARPAGDARGPRAAPTAARPRAGHRPGAVLGRDAPRRGPDGDVADEVVGFASATVREGLWFLAMLFVRPGLQAAGVGQALMDRAQAGRTSTRAGRRCRAGRPARQRASTPGACAPTPPSRSPTRSTRGAGMVPRIPRLAADRRGAALVRPAAAARLARGGAVRGGRRGRPGRPRRLAELVNDLDRELIGAAHPAEHAFLRREGRTGTWSATAATARSTATSTARAAGGWGRSRRSTRRSTRR